MRYFIILLFFIQMFANHPQVGDDAPAFSLKDQEGFTHTLAAHKGSFVLLFFYPRNFTVSSQKKLRQMQKLIETSMNDKFVVYGISRNSVENHRKFYDKLQISFDLLSDEQGDIISAYGASGLLETKPLVFLIGPDGRYFKVYENMQKFLYSNDLISSIIKNGI